MSVEIIYTNGPCGTCPVQAEGTINGHPFYFRSRHMRWSIRIACGKKSDPFDNDSWYYDEDYPSIEGEEHLRRVSAGYAAKEECIKFIERCAGIFTCKEP